MIIYTQNRTELPRTVTWTELPRTELPRTVTWTQSYALRLRVVVVVVGVVVGGGGGGGILFNNFTISN